MIEYLISPIVIVPVIYGLCVGVPMFIHGQDKPIRRRYWGAALSGLVVAIVAFILLVLIEIARIAIQ